MRKVIVLSFVMLFILGASLASAAPNVAGLTNRGSVLVFPLIDTIDGTSTYVKIGNDANQAVRIKCFWVKVDGTIAVAPDCMGSIGESEYKKLPPQQTPTDFVLTLTRNQPIMFDASCGSNDHFDPIPVTAAPFGPNNRGYLACWAVDANNAQINWNFLTGSAIILNRKENVALEYNAWTFGARSGSQGQKVGTPGTLLFDSIKYDSTPLYLLYNFPADHFDGFEDFYLFLVQGSQNFKTMTKAHHASKANMAVWNENETPYSGVGTCAWCWKEIALDDVSQGKLTTYEGLLSSVGRLRIQGIASSGCLPDLTDYQKERCLTAGTTFETYATGFLAVAVQEWGSGGHFFVNAGNTGGQYLGDKFTYDPNIP